jgi:hypothetical protein
MKVSVILFLVALTFTAGLFTERNAAVSIAQAKPDFSGTWNLDMAASDFGASKRGLIYDELTLVITYHDPELKITRKMVKKNRERVLELVYFTDGRGESNPDFSSDAKIKSRTKWDGNTLTSKSSTIIRGSTYVIESTDKWRLSPDSQTLIETSVGDLVYDPHSIVNRDELGKIKRVFRRSP